MQAAVERCRPAARVLSKIGPALLLGMCRGKPLREADPLRTGRTWRRPSPSAEIKSAALRTLCQALVPDSSRAKITQVGTHGHAAAACLPARWSCRRCHLRSAARLSMPVCSLQAYRSGRAFHPAASFHVGCMPASLQAMTDRARLVWELLEPLTETDPHAQQFEPFAFV